MIGKKKTLPQILGAFTTARDNLTAFIETQYRVIEQNHQAIDRLEDENDILFAEAAKANNALKGINTILEEPTTDGETAEV